MKQLIIEVIYIHHIWTWMKQLIIEAWAKYTLDSKWDKIKRNLMLYNYYITNY